MTSLRIKSFKQASDLPEPERSEACRLLRQRRAKRLARDAERAGGWARYWVDQGLDLRLAKVLSSAGYSDIKQLAAAKEGALLKLPRFGRQAMKSVRRIVEPPLEQPRVRVKGKWISYSAYLKSLGIDA